MARLAREGAGEGVWLRADRQSAGRGRLNRAWVSAPGNLHASTLVRLRPADPPAPSLALVTAVALHEALGVFVGKAALTIKWPNDVVADGAKLAGILLERHDDAVVIGCGANLAHHPDLADRPTTDLATLTGAAPGAQAVAEALADCFARALAVWRGEGVAAIVRRWLDAAHPLGTALAVRLPDGEAIDGLFDGLDAGGALRLRLAGGARRVIHAGDVFLVRD